MIPQMTVVADLTRSEGLAESETGCSVGHSSSIVSRKMLALLRPTSWLGQGGINGQVAMSALAFSCACPTAFIAHCSRLRFRRI